MSLNEMLIFSFVFHFFRNFFTVNAIKQQQQQHHHQRIQFSSSATPKPKNRVEDETISTDHNDIKVTKISLHNIQSDLDRLKQLQAQNEVVDKTAATSTTGKPTKKTDELPWRITPVAEFNQLMNHYLMLSKFRLTCEMTDRTF